MLIDYYHASRPVSFPTNNQLAFVSYSHESELNFFIDHLSEQQKDLMIYYLKKFNLKNIYMIMNSIERQHDCKFKEKNKLFYQYAKNYIMIYKMMLYSKQTKKELK
jgi:hypothetical protein